MEVATWVSIVSLVISMAALGLTARLASKQALYARSQVHMGFAAFFTEARDPEFIEDVRYVCHELRSEITETCPVSELPFPARRRVYRIANYFDQLGLLVASRSLEPDLIVGLLGNWLVQSWEALSPLIQAERKKRSDLHSAGLGISSGYLEFFGDLVVRARTRPPSVAQERLGLKRPT